MDLDRIRVFHAAAEAKSLTHAGQTLRLSQSAVSRQISALEEELGVTLFHRHARGLVLTEQGEILFNATRDVLATLDEARGRLVESAETPRGDLRITATVGMTTKWLIPRLPKFTARYPEINLHILIDDHELDLSTRPADIALRMRSPIQAGLIQRHLFALRFHIYASPLYLEEKGTPRTLADLDNHTLVVYGGTCPAELRELNWLLEIGRNGMPRVPALSINNVDAMAEAVEAGLGLALLPTYYGEKNPRMRRVLSDTPAPALAVHLVYAEAMRHSRRVTAFREFIYEEAKIWIASRALLGEVGSGSP
ncbi:MAG: LysR family transcriptional regulator [Alphaproteobacteria bacterium]|nr:LysR family transcriptional regulator [Alphaproteobacteria bacterium]